MTARVFLAIAGNIGSGKTTLTRRLVERLGFRGLYESTAENPYLADFYADMRRHALAMQLRFLAWRVEETRTTQRAGVSAVQDRTCYEDAEIFAANLHGRGEMDDRDWDTYRLIARQLLDGVEPPDLLVYLRRTPEGCASQIKTRGRDYEQKIPRAYLEELGARYDAWFEQYDRGPKLVVDGASYDFLNRDEHVNGLIERIAAELPQRSLPFTLL